ncbi:MAG TPA: DUF2255 family protein [Candidatus Dormibacteraeota bacterium]|nr:DUF2255 family protein [Candidatus Dormibacteraeota bacterium]
MTAWTSEELSTISKAEEVDLASIPESGSVRNRVTIWVVRHGDDLYVRSVRGRKGAWFLAAKAAKSGRIWAGALQRDVSFEEADAALGHEIDAAYRSKYRRYAGRILDSVLTPDARSTTLRLMPR